MEMLRKRRFSDLLRLSLRNHHPGWFHTADEGTPLMSLRNRIAVKSFHFGDVEASRGRNMILNNLTNNLTKSFPTVTLLLLAVNVPLAVLVALLLVTDYQREMRRATDARRITLSDEASVIGNALLRLSEPNDTAAITAFLESSCEETAGPGTPGHWIDVRWNGNRLHTHTGPDIEPNSEPKIGQVGDALVGRFASGDLQVAVTERAAEIRRGARGETVMHLSGILGLASLAAIIVDIVLVRVIANPTRRLTEAVEQLQSNRFNMEPLSFTSRELNELNFEIARMAESLRHSEADRSGAMRRARDIQNHLLPRRICIPGLAFATHFQPAKDVAGDIYGVLQMRDKSWLIYISDLVGHGIPAAISAAVLKMVIDSAAGAATDPGVIMNRVNRILPQYLSDSEFATAAILRWNPEKAELSFASAGHEPILLITQRRLVTLDATGIPSGIDPSACWTTRNHSLVPGDRLLLATDGVAETHDANDQQFGRSRLAELFNNSHSREIEDFAAHLEREITSHRGAAPIEDDVTFLIAECRHIDVIHQPCSETTQCGNNYIKK